MLNLKLTSTAKRRKPKQSYFIVSVRQTGQTRFGLQRTDSKVPGDIDMRGADLCYHSISRQEDLHIVPTPILKQIVQDHSVGRVKSPNNKTRLIGKVWKIMAEETAQATEVNEADAKAAKAKEKEEAKAKKAEEAKAKKEAAEKAKAEAKAKKEAEAKAKKEAAEKAKAAKKSGNIDKAETITVLVEGNPKRAGSDSARRFDLYKNGMTVAQFLEAGGTMSDINWDLGHRLISLAPPSQSQTANA